MLAASIFHFGEYRVADARHHLSRHGIPVRHSRSRELTCAATSGAIRQDGVVPVVVQESRSGDVLMLAVMNARRSG